MGIIEERIKKIDEEIKMNQKMIQLLKYKGVDRIVTAEEKMQAVLKEQAKRPKIIAKTGIPKLDDLFDGFRTGTLNVISGPTGEGKTTFLQTLTNKFYDNDIKSVWFPFEGISDEFFDKFHGDVKHFYMPREVPEKGNSREWLKDRILEAKVKFDCNVAFIDHLHYLKDMQGVSGTDQLSLYIGDIMRSLKQFAMEAGVILFLIVHVKSESGVVNAKRQFYTKDDIRDSSFVKQEADSVMMIYRARRETQLNDAGWEYTDKAILNVDKNRRTGRVGFIKLIHKGLFEEYDEFGGS